MAKDDPETQYVGEQPTKQKPGEDPDEANQTGLAAEGFKQHGSVVKGVQPMTDEDIPETGR